MKKVSIFLIILLTLVLVSCRQTTPTETPSGESSASTEESTTLEPDNKTPDTPEISKLLVEWNQIVLPEEAKRVDGITIEGGTIYVAEGSLPPKIWKSDDGGNSWSAGYHQELEEWIRLATQGGHEEESDLFNGRINYADGFGAKKVKGKVTELTVCFSSLDDQNSFDKWNFAISFDEEKSWVLVNLPQPYAYELGERLGSPILWYWWDFTYSDNELKLFFLYPLMGEIWQVTIKAP